MNRTSAEELLRELVAVKDLQRAVDASMHADPDVMSDKTVRLQQEFLRRWKAAWTNARAHVIDKPRAEAVDPQHEEASRKRMNLDRNWSLCRCPVCEAEYWKPNAAPVAVRMQTEQECPDIETAYRSVDVFAGIDKKATEDLRLPSATERCESRQQYEGAEQRNARQAEWNATDEVTKLIQALEEEASHHCGRHTHVFEYVTLQILLLHAAKVLAEYASGDRS